jgi:hypothetical protein
VKKSNTITIFPRGTGVGPLSHEVISVTAPEPGGLCPGLAAEWSPETPETAWHVRPSGQSNYVPTWICTTNSAHVWQATLVWRNAGSGCPDFREAGKSRVKRDHCAAAQAVWSDVRSGETIRDERFTTNRQWTGE